MVLSNFIMHVKSSHFTLPSVACTAERSQRGQSNFHFLNVNSSRHGIWFAHVIGRYDIPQVAYTVAALSGGSFYEQNLPLRGCPPATISA